MIELFLMAAIVAIGFASTIFITHCAATDKANLKWREWCENFRYGYGPDGLDRDGNSAFPEK